VAVSGLGLQAQLKLRTRPSTLRREITSAIARELNQKWTHNTALHRLLNNGVSHLLLQGMQQSPEYQSLIAEDGRLRQELGLPVPQAMVDPIVEKAAKTVNVVFTPFRSRGRKVVGTARITALPNNFEDLLVAEPSGSYVTEDGTTIPWLDWMLRLGDRIIVLQHEIEYRPGPSRTGSYVMVPSEDRGWRVPPEYSGTVGNNFITRSADAVAPQIGEFVSRKLDGVL